MRSLLLVAHGSRREASNEEIRQLTATLRERADTVFDTVDCAFLELAEPSIPAGIDHCVARGATEVVILPYFLSAGRHVSEDIPAEVDSRRSQYPDVALTVAPYLGSMPGLTDLIFHLAKASQSGRAP